MAFAGWIPSYLVIQEIETKEGTALISSIFWISITAFIFILANWKGTPH